jgi:hypothetical protein
MEGNPLSETLCFVVIWILNDGQSPELSQNFLGFCGGDYEEYRLLGCYAVWLLVRTDVAE